MPELPPGLKAENSWRWHFKTQRVAQLRNEGFIILSFIYLFILKMCKGAHLKHNSGWLTIINNHKYKFINHINLVPQLFPWDASQPAPDRFILYQYLGRKPDLNGCKFRVSSFVSKKMQFLKVMIPASDTYAAKLQQDLGMGGKKAFTLMDCREV